MQTANEQRREADRLLDQAEAIAKRAIREKRTLTRVEEQEFEGYMERVDELQAAAKDVDLRVRKSSVSASGQKARGVPLPGLPSAGPSRGARRCITSTKPEDRSYRSMFPGAAHDACGFESLDEFMGAVHGGHDPRLAEVQKRAMSEGTPHEGGFAVPTPMAQEIFDAAIEDEVVRPRARLYPMTSDTLKIPALTIGSHASDTLYGSLLAYWKGEGVSLTEAQPDLRQVELNCSKLVAYGVVSSELLDDGISFDEMLTEKFIQAVSFKLDRAFLAGDGAGKPQGILNSPALITVSKESGQADDTVVTENVHKMWARLWPGSARNAVWAVHPTVLPQLYSMHLAVGTGGAPVYLPAGGVSAQPYPTLMGRPVVVTEKLEVLGDKGDVLLLDPTQYAVGLRAGVQVARSTHVKFDSDQVAYRAIIRAAGQGLWDEALTLRDGSTTVSPFVTLEARES